MLTGSIIQDIKNWVRYGNMVTRLIIANIAVFLVLAIINLISYLSQSYGIYTSLLVNLQVPASLPALIYQPWSILTYMFLHVGIFHILFNMLWLYWFGEIFVVFLGDKKVLPLYLLGGIAGALIYIACYNLVPVFKPQAALSVMMGASASVFAIVFAAATISPEYEIRLMFLGNIRIKYIALIALLLGVINIPNGNAGGYIAHVGGALFGYGYIKSLQGGFDLTKSFNRFFDWIATILKRKPRVKVSHKNVKHDTSPGPPRSDGDQRKLDVILDKISRSGYDSLTKEEKDFLFHYSKK